MSRKKSTARHVGEVLAAMGRSDIKGRLRYHKIFSGWSNIVGAELARISRPIEIRGRTLRIVAKNSACAFQMKTMEPQITAKIRDYLGENTVKELFVRVGEIQDDDVLVEKREDDHLAVEEIQIPIKKVEELEKCLSDVDDEMLRESLRKLGYMVTYKEGKPKCGS